MDTEVLKLVVQSGAGPVVVVVLMARLAHLYYLDRCHRRYQQMVKDVLQSKKELDVPAALVAIAPSLEFQAAKSQVGSLASVDKLIGTSGSRGHRRLPTQESEGVPSTRGTRSGEAV